MKRARDQVFLIRMTSALFEIQCLDRTKKSLTPEQNAAFHAMKHEVLASINRMYMHVPADTANFLLENAILKMYETLSVKARKRIATDPGQS